MRDSPIKDSAIEFLRRLPKDWDSYGAPPVGEGAIETLRGIQIVPTSPGGVQVEWHLDGWDIEIEFNASGGVETVMVGKA